MKLNEAIKVSSNAVSLSSKRRILGDTSAIDAHASSESLVATQRGRSHLQAKDRGLEPLHLGSLGPQSISELLLAKLPSP